jgi:DNA-binding transcriptional LysR family regulator
MWISLVSTDRHDAYTTSEIQRMMKHYQIAYFKSMEAKDMTSKQVQYYFSVYKHCNITKAAEELIVTRPVISRALAEIENIIGVKLFDRKSSGLTPTEPGVMLFNMLDSFSKTYAVTVERLRNLSLVKESHNLRIGMMDASSGWFYPLVYHKFLEKYPDIIVNVEGINAEEAESLIFDGTLDVAIAPIMRDSSLLLGSQYLYTTQWVLCSPKNSTKAGVVEAADSEGIDISITAELSVAILETLPPPFYKYRDIVLSTKDPEMVRVAVSSGYAHAVLPLELCAHWDGVLNRPFVPLAAPGIYLIWNKIIPHSSSFNDFVNFVKGIDFESLRKAWGDYKPVVENQ